MCVCVCVIGRVPGERAPWLAERPCSRCSSRAHKDPPTAVCVYVRACVCVLYGLSVCAVWCVCSGAGGAGLYELGEECDWCASGCVRACVVRARGEGGVMRGVCGMRCTSVGMLVVCARVWCRLWHACVRARDAYCVWGGSMSAGHGARPPSSELSDWDSSSTR